MDKRWKNAVIAVLAVVLTGAVVWGVVENVRHRRYRMQLQAMYERSFFQLVGEMDDLEVKLGKLTVSDGAKQDVILLSEVYRQADGAGRELASLPGSHQSMEEVLAFVNRLSEFSGALAQKVAKGESISKEDEEQLESLLERCRALNYAVQGLSAQDVASAALSTQPAQPDEEGDPYAEFAKPSTPVPSLIYDGAFSQAARTPPKALGTQSVDEDAALEIAKAYVGPERIESIAPEQGVEGEIPCYGIAVNTTDAGVIHLQVTKTGGHVLMMVPEFSPGETNHSVDACRAKRARLPAEPAVRRGGARLLPGELRHGDVQLRARAGRRAPLSGFDQGAGLPGDGAGRRRGGEQLPAQPRAAGLLRRAHGAGGRGRPGALAGDLVHEAGAHPALQPGDPLL